jgi:ATP-binding cassette subfamily B protein
MNKKILRQKIGIVLQEPWVYKDTIMNNLKYTSDSIFTEQEIFAICRKINLDRVIRTLPNGYNTIISEETNLSAGQKQLITIARTIIQNHKIIILDEATSNIDTQLELTIQKALDELFRGRTSIIIAHRLSTIINADKIIVLKDGSIAEQGSHEELLKINGLYSKLYNSQFEEEEN